MRDTAAEREIVLDWLKTDPAGVAVLDALVEARLKMQRAKRRHNSQTEADHAETAAITSACALLNSLGAGDLMRQRAAAHGLNVESGAVNVSLEELTDVADHTTKEGRGVQRRMAARAAYDVGTLYGPKFTRLLAASFIDNDEGRHGPFLDAGDFKQGVTPDVGPEPWMRKKAIITAGRLAGELAGQQTPREVWKQAAAEYNAAAAEHGYKTVSWQTVRDWTRSANPLRDLFLQTKRETRQSKVIRLTSEA